MLTEIIRKEILEHLMSLRFAIACVLCFVVVLCSLFVRYQDYNMVSDDYNHNVLMTRTESKTIDNPWSVLYGGTTIHQAPNPLKVFLRGVEADNGISIRVTGHEPAQIVGSSLANPIVPLFQAMDMINFVGIIMSLLAIIFGYDAICGEKQRGTLRLMLSYSIPRDKVLMGKWIGGIITLFVPFLLTIICAATIILIQPNISLTQSHWMKLAGVCGLALLYIAGMYSMAMWISCVTPRPSTSIMILVTIWLVLVLAIPNLSPYLAQSLKATKDPTQVETARMIKMKEIWTREIDDKFDAANKKFGLTKQRWWQEIDWGDNDDWKRGMQRWLFELDCRGNAYRQRLTESRRIDDDFARGLDAQIRLSRWISRLSPFSCFAMSATELTDTGIVSKRRFIEQVRDFQEQICDFGVSEWKRKDNIRVEIHGTGKEEPPWPSDEFPIPKFAFTPSAKTGYFQMVVLDGGLLAGFMIVFLMLSYVSFLRYDVR